MDRNRWNQDGTNRIEGAHRIKDWRELCRAAANESDPAKLINLIAELTKALDERNKNGRPTSEEIPHRNKEGGARCLQS
jgi:hypothetical protein